MAKRVKLEDVMYELKTIKNLVLKNLQLDEEEIKLDKQIMKAYKKPAKGKKRIFDDMIGWQANIWNECEHKKIVSNKEEFEFYCGLLKKICNHGHCPLNIKKK